MLPALAKYYSEIAALPEWAEWVHSRDESYQWKVTRPDHNYPRIPKQSDILVANSWPYDEVPTGCPLTRIHRFSSRCRKHLEKLHGLALAEAMKNGVFGTIAPLLEECARACERVGNHWIKQSYGVQLESDEWWCEVAPKFEQALERLKYYLPADIKPKPPSNRNRDTATTLKKIAEGRSLGGQKSAKIKEEHFGFIEKRMRELAIDENLTDDGRHGKIKRELNAKFNLDIVSNRSVVRALIKIKSQKTRAKKKS